MDVENVGEYQKGANSSFRTILLAFARDQLNLMLSEVCQLKKEDADFSSNEKLTTVVLEKIANREIHSPHISQEQAQNYLRLLSSCDYKKQEYIVPSEGDKDASLEDEEALSPYFNSPF